MTDKSALPTSMSGIAGLRLLKSLLVFLMGAFACLVALNNIVDYGSNFAFVQHVLSMDTTFPDNSQMWRAINTPALHHLFYWIIIAFEFSAGVICLAATWKMYSTLKAPYPEFFKALMLASWGLCIGITLWFGGFMIVGAEWYLMWQSPDWNGQPAAFRFIVSLSFTLVFLHLPEPLLKSE